MATIRIKVCIDLHLDGAFPLFIVSPRVIERVAFERHAGGTGYRPRIRDKKLLRTRITFRWGGIDVTYRSKFVITSIL